MLMPFETILISFRQSTKLVEIKRKCRIYHVNFKYVYFLNIVIVTRDYVKKKKEKLLTVHRINKSSTSLYGNFSYLPNDFFIISLRNIN